MRTSGRRSFLGRGAARAWALAAGFAALALGGCDNNPNPRPLHETRPGDPASGGGQPWTTSYRALGEDPRTLDPQVSYDTLGHALIAQLYESPLQYSPYKTAPYELEPCLLAEMPRRERHADGSETWTLRVKPGVFFHDDPCFPGGKGRELTAADFLHTFQRIADPAVECPVVSSLQEYIVGLEEAYAATQKKPELHGWLPREVQDQMVCEESLTPSNPSLSIPPHPQNGPYPGVQQVDKYTFRLHLKKPWPQLSYWLAMPFTAPVPREAVAYYNGKDGRDLFRFHPVGTGPYRVHLWERGRRIRLVRHAGYNATRFPTGGWPAADEARLRPLAGSPLPLIDEVQFAVIRESMPAWVLFRQGYLDRYGVNKDVFNSVITAGQTLSEEHARRGVLLFKDVGVGTFYFQFNMADPVLGGTDERRTKLRQALSTAYNQDRANELFSNGIDIKAEQLLPPGVAGYDPAFRNPYRTQDLGAARRLLAEAGYPGGIDPATGQPLVLTLDVVASGNAAGRQMAEYSQSQIEQLGVRCKIEENIWARFQEKQIRGEFQFNAGSGWNADYPDPENFFFLFYGKNLPPAGFNASRLADPEFDRLYEQMATMDDGPERLALIRRMTARLTELCPSIYTSHPVSFVLSQPWLPRTFDNALLNSGGGLKYASLDPKLRAEKIKEWNRAPMWPLWLGGVLALALAACVVRKARESTL